MSTQHRIGRRALLSALGAGLGGAVAACGNSTTASPTSATAATAAASSSSACAVTAEETAGPYPDMLGMASNSAFFRRDVTEGRPGTPLALTLTVVNTNRNCAAVANVSVEIWQCDASGNYSEYSQPGYNGTGQTFLRGLQVTDANGQVTFATIYPGWYAGRTTHIHVQVFRNGSVIKTTQVAFPASTTSAVYATGVYAAKGQNPTANGGDMVFSDGTSTELATVSGGSSGYTAALTIGVAV